MPDDKGKMVRVCITRYGYAEVPFEGLDDNVNNLKESDIEWEPITTDVLGAYEIMESYTMDNAGRVLTKEQQEYFAKSALRDGSGMLLTLYHGTTCGREIKIFRVSDHGYLGPGIYMSPRLEQAKEHADDLREGAGTIYSLYANITNPLKISGSDPVPEVLNAVYGNVRGPLVYEKRKQTQGNEAYLITAKDIGILKRKGYDGIWWTCGMNNAEVSAFCKNQIKRIDNSAPTACNDIRK